jgi:hypothetical protein
MSLSTFASQGRERLFADGTQILADGRFYNHLYDDEVLIVIFKTRVFRATAHCSSWAAIQQYGISLDIPVAQLDFWPNRFQDEIHYFGRKDFVKQL